MVRQVELKMKTFSLRTQQKCNRDAIHALMQFVAVPLSLIEIKLKNGEKKLHAHSHHGVNNWQRVEKKEKKNETV